MYSSGSTPIVMFRRMRSFRVSGAQITQRWNSEPQAKTMVLPVEVAAAFVLLRLRQWLLSAKNKDLERANRHSKTAFLSIDFHVMFLVGLARMQITFETKTSVLLFRNRGGASV
jgi:hypothetical protein